MSKASEASVPDTVEGLRRQNSAYRALCASLEATQAIQTAEGRKYHEAVSTLESERAANAILTDENARLTKERDMAVEALRPFAKMGKMLEGPFAPALFKDEDSFVSGGAWRENGEVRTLTFGDLRRAYFTLAQLEASKGEG